ncbi:uncharacterized protein LOC136042062 isoform X1 [Artemia franciscana]|uniref:uncharacterized protein LOC136042062 isoform X1 n=1 Tax=Artemia franciscana TaxID=6661 RepID=UPI0032D9F386
MAGKDFQFFLILIMPRLPLTTAVTTHPREKTILLNQRIGEGSQKQLSSSGDEQVNQQLIQALALTSSDASQINDGTEGAVHEPGRPELLKSVLTIFAGPNQAVTTHSREKTILINQWIGEGSQ